jgi:hypothetical protein
MKKINFYQIACIAILAITTSNIAQARILRVNNTGISLAPQAPNTLPIYVTAQAAHDAAVSGDTIHIEPSGVTYGVLTITKQLVIIGNGYFLGLATSNFNPNLQANTGSSMLDYIYLNAGSSNSTITGISIAYFQIASDASTLNNLTIKRNRIINNFTFQGTVSNSKITQNYIDAIPYGYGALSNFLLANNIMSFAPQFDANDNGVVENNIINLGGAGYGVNLPNCIIRNNIECAGFGGNFSGATVQNNMSVGTTFGNLDGNIQNANLTNVFEDWTNVSASFSTDSRLQLKAGSPAIGAGFGSVNMGAYGGSFPYVFSGIPNVPSIFKLNTPAIVTSNTMSVNISTRSNN